MNVERVGFVGGLDAVCERVRGIRIFAKIRGWVIGWIDEFFIELNKIRRE